MLPTFMQPRPRLKVAAEPNAGHPLGGPTPNANEAGAVRSHPNPAAREQNQLLEELEKQIKGHKRSWIYAGRALAQIKEQGLFRHRAKDTFEEYVERWDAWDISLRQALDLIRAAEAAKNWRGIEHALSLRAALQLAKLPAADQAQMLRQSIAGAGTLSPTAEHLRAAVAARMGSPTRKRGKKEAARRILLSEGTLTIAGRKLTIITKKAGVELVSLLREALSQLATPP